MLRVFNSLSSVHRCEGSVIFFFVGGKQFFCFTFEVDMEYILSKIEVEIYRVVNERCDGCRHMLENQQGHICIMNTEEDNVLEYFDEAYERVVNNGGVKMALWKSEAEILMLSRCKGWSIDTAREYLDISNTEDNPIEVSSNEESDGEQEEQHEPRE